MDRVPLKQLLKSLDHFDRALSQRIAQPPPNGRSRLLTLFGAHLGDSWLWLLIALLLRHQSGMSPEPERTERRRLLTRFYLATLTSIMTTLALKQLFQRGRPGEGSMLYGAGVDIHSFPSGHAARMATIAFWSNRLWPGRGPLGWLLAFVIGGCRVRLGIHYVGDVVVGLGLGSVIGWLFERGRSTEGPEN